MKKALRRGEVCFPQMENFHIPVSEFFHSMRMDPKRSVSVRYFDGVEVNVISDVEVELGDFCNILCLVNLKRSHIQKDPRQLLQKGTGTPECLDYGYGGLR